MSYYKFTKVERELLRKIIVNFESFNVNKNLKIHRPIRRGWAWNKRRVPKWGMGKFWSSTKPFPFLGEQPPVAVRGKQFIIYWCQFFREITFKMELIKSTKFKEDEINMPMWSKSWILFAYQNIAKFNSVGETHPDLSLY